MGLAAPAAPTASTSDVAFFEARVRPLLLNRCVGCHGSKIAQGGLRLDRPEGALRGDAGPVVVPGTPDASPLVTAVRYTNPRLQMPPAGRLPQAEIAILEDWVRRGAPVPAPAGTPGSAKGASRGVDPAAGRLHWAFQPLRRMDPPGRTLRTPGRSRVDAHLDAALVKAGITPAARAERRVLIRRAYFDLVGIPPTPEEVEAFVRDSAPDAWQRLVDRLLASSHYGERWGRHWLDLVRYCDVPESWAQTEAQAWLYRDWVVQALNADVPYDRFVSVQLAADELPGVPPKDLAALGLLGLSPSYWKELKLAPDVIKTVVAEEWEERIGTISGALLGLTAACARCHDHKFDPISMRDYYALAGVLAGTRLVPRPLLEPESAKRVLGAIEQVRALEADAKKLQGDAARDKMRAEDLRRRAAEKLARAEEIKKGTPDFSAPLAYGVETASLAVVPDGPDRTRLEHRAGVGQDIPLQLRGNPASPGPVVPRGFLSVLSPGTPPRFTRGSGRRDLAEAIFREGAALTARVMVNRVWRHHFGRGLVETPSNFGLQGERPSHPELLDDLAARFIEAGWSLKWLHREVMRTDAYQRGDRAPAAMVARDPDNRLVGRMVRRRLEVEAWRDAILAASGRLDSQVGGAPEELSAAGNNRRTLYGLVRRRDLDDLLRLYDFPDPTGHSPARFPTTTPLQQLYVLNSSFLGQHAAALAGRLAKEAGDDPGARVRRAYLVLFGREAQPHEVRTCIEFVGQESRSAKPEEAWTRLAEVLLARNELAYVE